MSIFKWPGTAKWLLFCRFLNAVLFLGGIHIDDYYEHWNVVQDYVSYMYYNGHLQLLIKLDYKLHSHSLMMSNFYFRGKTHERRYRFLMAFGYTFPTVISLFTLLTEFVAPECASYKPRFGEERCFFAGWYKC